MNVLNLRRLDKHLLTFLTIDFYNHETQHTNIAEGLITNFNFQITFKVKCDEFFIKFLESDFIKIELYAAKGEDAIKLGYCNIPLIELKTRNSEDQSSVVIDS